MKKQRSYTVALFFLALSFFIVGCSKTPDEEQIKQIVDSMVSAMEAGKPSDIAKHLDPDFRANRQMDVLQVKQMLLMFGMQHKSVSITIVSNDTRVDPVYTDRAHTVISVITTGSSGGFPDDGSVRVVNLDWRKNGDWKLLKADWE